MAEARLPSSGMVAERAGDLRDARELPVSGGLSALLELVVVLLLLLVEDESFALGTLSLDMNLLKPTLGFLRVDGAEDDDGDADVLEESCVGLVVSLADLMEEGREDVVVLRESRDEVDRGRGVGFATLTLPEGVSSPWSFVFIPVMSQWHRKCSPRMELYGLQTLP